MRGVCNTPLHGCMKNLAGFIFPHTDTPKTHPVLDPKPSAQDIWGRMLLRPTRVRPKFGEFHISAHGYAKNAPDFTFPNKDTPKTRPILDPNLRRRTFRGICFCAPTRVRAKFDGFHISAYDMTRNPAGFGLCHSTWRETRRVLDFVTRHGAKPGGFWTLPLDIA